LEAKNELELLCKSQISFPRRKGPNVVAKKFCCSQKGAN
jgi:hypothetical protein